MLKKLILFILFSYSFSVLGQAQKKTVKGKVTDVSSNIGLFNTSVVLLSTEGHFILADTRADAEGNYELKNIESNHYLLLFTRPGYVDFSKAIDLKNTSERILVVDGIKLYRKAVLLEEVIIKAKVSAIKILGDTVEFAADSFKVQPNASVEDLLRQLPNIQIDQNGKITAQGKQVKRVLVDGEEFFGGDPLLVTRNLRADMIDKVQLYDKKSDASEFSGVNDGIKDKTINLKLKENKKQGYFGKATAGVGNKGFYNGQGMINLFQTNRKLSAYVTRSNIGQSGLAKEDKERIGSDEEGNGSYTGKGIPIITSAGVHYDERWGENKKNINGNAKIFNSIVDESNETITEYTLPMEVLRTNNNVNSRNVEFSNKYNLTFKDIHSKSTAFKAYVDFNFLKRNSDYTSETESNNAEYLILQNNENRVTDNVFKNINLNLELQKKFKKQGRTIASYLNSSYYTNRSTGNTTSTNKFFNQSGGTDSLNILNLNKEVVSDNKSLNLNTIYSEPVSKNLSMSLNYLLGSGQLSDDRESIDAIQQGVISERFSSNLTNTNLDNKFGINFNYNRKKLFFNFGGNYSLNRLRIDDIRENNVFVRNFNIWESRAKLTYRFSDYKFFEINYTGNPNKPTASQLLPARYNNSLTVTTLPNLELNTSSSNKFDFAYTRFAVQTETTFNVNTSYMTTSNPIGLSTNISPTGVYIYQYENLPGKTNNNLSLDVLYGTKLKKIDARIYTGVTSLMIKTFTKTNGASNQLNANNYSVYFGINKVKQKQYTLNLSSSATYYENIFSLQDLKNNFLGIYSRASIDVFVGKIQLHTDGAHQWQQKIRDTDKNFNVFIWNAWLGKSFAKKEELLIKISCNDILGENTGFNRSATNNYFTQNTYRAIQRFFLVSATWNFNRLNDRTTTK